MVLMALMDMRSDIYQDRPVNVTPSEVPLSATNDSWVTEVSDLALASQTRHSSVRYTKDASITTSIAFSCPHIPSILNPADSRRLRNCDSVLS